MRRSNLLLLLDVCSTLKETVCPFEKVTCYRTLISAEDFPHSGTRLNPKNKCIICIANQEAAALIQTCMKMPSNTTTTTGATKTSIAFVVVHRLERSRGSVTRSLNIPVCVWLRITVYHYGCSASLRPDSVFAVENVALWCTIIDQQENFEIVYFDFVFAWRLHIIRSYTSIRVGAGESIPWTVSRTIIIFKTWL